MAEVVNEEKEESAGSYRKLTVSALAAHTYLAVQDRGGFPQWREALVGLRRRRGIMYVFVFLVFSATLVEPRNARISVVLFY